MKHWQQILSPAAAVAAALLAAGCAGSGGMMEGGMAQPAAGAAMSEASMESMMTGWHEASRKAAMHMMNTYGPPNEMTQHQATWHQTGPWKRTVISHEAVQHNFPMPHPDVMEQVVNYQVPPEMFDELAMYDGSVIVERTKGELSARCDAEGANFLALNLAHEIITGKTTVEAARQKYGQEIKMMKAGNPTSYTQRLLFEPMSDAAADFPDQPIM